MNDTLTLREVLGRINPRQLAAPLLIVMILAMPAIDTAEMFR